MVEGSSRYRSVYLRGLSICGHCREGELVLEYSAVDVLAFEGRIRGVFD